MKRPVLLLSLLLVGSLVVNGPFVRAIADQPAADPQPATNLEPPADEPRIRYELPEGGLDELVAFIKELQGFRPRTTRELLDHRSKGPQAIQQAAEKILSLEDDPSSDAYKLATLALLEARVQDIRNVDLATKQEIVSEVADALGSRSAAELSSSDVNLAMAAVRGLEHGGHVELAAEAFEKYAETLRTAEDDAVRKRAEKMEGAARRLRLPGNTLELTGTLLDGSQFDWDAYRGKVVLVDFWATWCGPCIAELPNIKKHYELYHDRGFDVVGISLDRSREALEQFLEKEPHPWPTLYEDEAGWDHPMATYYGVMGIPTVLLVDKEGKVVSLRARGSELGRLLEEQLGPVDEQRLREYEERLRRESEPQAEEASET